MAPAGYGCIASRQDRNGESTDWKGWLLNCHDKGMNVLRQVSKAGSTSSVVDNQWHMVTGTYDAEAGVLAIYVDGKLEAESQPSSNVALTNDFPVIFGSGTVFGDFSAYEGLIDKLSIYSYAISPFDVAMLYTDVAGGEICLEQPEYDFNGDCQVDILDFAMFATEWLECNIVPASSCL